MNEYKTSLFTFFCKYLFVPVWGSGALYGVVMLATGSDKDKQWSAMTLALMLTWMLTWYLPIALRLRRAVANADHLLIKKFNGTEVINYADIEYVSQPAMINPKFISIKYTDRESGTSGMIYLIPSRTRPNSIFTTFAEFEMTQFIRQQIRAVNPQFTRAAEPSRWKPFVLMIGSLIVLMLILFLLTPGRL